MSPSRKKAKKKERVLMDATAMRRALNRVAHEILERNPDVENFALIGIRTRGVPLSQRLAAIIEGIEDKPVQTGILDITLYRDDLTTIAAHPVVGKTEIDFDLSRKTVVLVDDVLYTGRTVRAALDALVDFGRPRSIQAAVLIDRGRRELPIHADYVGKTVQTSSTELVHVLLKEIDREEQVILTEGN